MSGPAARHAARVELSHHEYQRDRPSLLSRVVSWIGRHLNSVLSGGAGNGAVVLVVVLLLAGLIFFAVRSGVPRMRVRAAGAADRDPLAPMAARDHRRIAAELTAQGRLNEALREWLRAAVQTIEQRGVLPPLPGRTGSATAREAGPLLPTAAADEVRAARIVRTSPSPGLAVPR